MGCFLACFCSSEHRKPKSSGTNIPSQSRHHTHEAPPHPAEPAKPEEIEEPLFPTSQSKESVDEHQKPNCCGKKKVTFDLIVETNEKLPTKNDVEKIGNESEKKDKSSNESELGFASTKVSYPPTHRYHGSTHTGNEHDLSSLEVSDFDGDSGKDEEEERKNGWEATFVQEESSESLFSLSIDSRKHIYGGETGDKEVNSPMMPVCDSPEKKVETTGSNLNPSQDSSKDVLSVLIPVENLTQWKSAKTRIATPASKKRQDKENVGFKQDCEKMATDFEFSALKPKLNQDFGVDTSLSNWLVVSKTNRGSAEEEVSSKRSYEDKPKLGAVGVEEEIELSASSCSPNRSHDIVLGTVGSYWSHTGQTLDSNSSSSCTKGSEEVAKEVKVQWKSDPFEARLVAKA